MSNKLISIGMMLVLMWPLSAGDKRSPVQYSGPSKDISALRSIDGVGSNLRIIGSNVDYDAVLTKNNVLASSSYFGVGRGTADTLQYVPADGSWNGQFIQSPGDAMLVMFKMPADGIIKGVNVPVYEWGTGEQQMTVSLHAVSYPMTADGATYPSTAVDGNGWIGGYDMDAEGNMLIQGTEYSAGGTASVCQPTGSVVAGAIDPLGTEDGTGPEGVPTKGLIWPDGFTSSVLTPDANPAGGDNWVATADLGSEPEVTSGTWVGILFEFTGAGGGDDEATGFYYEMENNIDPWVFAKFYAGCGGTSGNGGWHIRHWMIHAQLAVELTGDRGPVFGEITDLPTTLSTAARPFSAHVTDDNPSGEAAGVSAVTLSYQIDSTNATLNSVSLSLSDGSNEDGTWSGEMPAAASGQTVYWSVTAYDNNGNATATAQKSYFIFQATPGSPLLFMNGAPFLSNPLYEPYLYYGWGLNPFDWWLSDYGNVTTELFDQYNVIFDRAGNGAVFNTDEVANPWFQSGDKVYIAEGDEWLGTRYGWSGSMDMEPGSFARNLGVATYHPDINGTSGAVSRLVPNPDDVFGAIMDDYLDSAMVTMYVDSSSADTSAWDTTYSYAAAVLDYDPYGHIYSGYSHSNWLDGVDPHEGAHAAYWGYPGVVDSLGDQDPAAELQPVAVYSQHGSGSVGAVIGFDQLSLFARVYDDTGAVSWNKWVGPEDYASGVPGGIVKAIMDWATDDALGVDEVMTPESFSLKGNYPNPFNPSTNIMFTLGMENDVTVSVYSILGEEIATLHSGRMIPGTHSIRWNGLTKSGYNVASGVYFYQVNVAGQVKTGKMMLLK